MGFSTSGAVAVMLIAFLVAGSVLVPTLFNVSAETGEAFSTKADQIRDQQNTALDITTSEYQFEEDEDGEITEQSLVINVTNTGSQTLDIGSTDLLIDGGYISLPADDITVHVPGEDDPREDTTIWPPEATLEITFDSSIEFDDGSEDKELEDAERVKIVTERGVSVSSTVEEVDQGGDE